MMWWRLIPTASAGLVITPSLTPAWVRSPWKPSTAPFHSGRSQPNDFHRDFLRAIPDIATNPGNRVTLDLAGLTSPLLTVTGVGSGELTYGAAAIVTLHGVDSLGGTLQPDNSVVPLDLRLEASLAAGADAYRLSRNGAALETAINGQLYFRADLAVVNELQFNDPLTMTLADLQTLTVDFAGGDPIPQGGVFFHAGQTGLGQSQITLENGSFGVVRHDLRSGDAGQVVFDASRRIAPRRVVAAAVCGRSWRPARSPTRHGASFF